MRNALNSKNLDCKMADKITQVSTTRKNQCTLSPCSTEQML